ncbi:PP2C family protein-serine/threonine phosphatase [Nonomuraea sp. NPDC059194]|uniref:PP2C family protein-serine/threonine phosphatase n=1 Tax=Nonomuraea sp. NPDC059194 TaxID=3346764 RepID=UPI0036A41602
MSVLEAIRRIWSPGDKVMEFATGEGLPPVAGTYIAPSLDLGRHRLLLSVLTVAALAVGPLAVAYGTAWAPPITLAPIILTSGLLLRLPAIGVVLAASAISAVTTLAVKPELAQLAVLVLVAALAVSLGNARAGVGVYGLRGDQALIELKNQLKATNQIPPLPRRWGRKVALQAAPGALFGGDFLVSRLEDSRLQLALVDVSGKGDDAAAHALMLSGTFGGLLASVPAERFLPSCNDYLLRRGEERLVTAVHLDLDLTTGVYTVACAGHPPVAQYFGGSGTWQPSTAAGIALGVTDHVRWPTVGGTLGKGDALMLITNGLWGPRADPDTGLDRILGEAHSLVREGFTETATLVKRVRNREDDSALVLIWRT